MKSVTSPMINLPDSKGVDLAGIAFPGEKQGPTSFAKNTTRGIKVAKGVTDVATYAASCAVM